MPSARVEGGALVAHALALDRFGNVMLDVEHGELSEAGLRLGRPVAGQRRARPSTRRPSPTSQPGALLLYEDAYRTLALAVNRGSAAEHLGVALDDELRIAPG